MQHWNNQATNNLVGQLRSCSILMGLGIIHPCLPMLLVLFFVQRQSSKLPSDDPFYFQPENSSMYPPGDIIASRPVTANLNGLLGGSLTNISLSAAYRFLYRTTDSLQNPVAAVSDVLVPHHPHHGKLFSYQTAYDSPNINCSPSHSLQAGANNTAMVHIVMVHLLSPPPLYPKD